MDKLDNFTLGDSSESDVSTIEDQPKKKMSPQKSFEWKALDRDWQIKLMSDTFVRRDSIGDGDCQFRSIETALTNAGYRTNHKKIRKIIAKYIKDVSEREFAEIINHYIIEKQSGEFRGDWDPSTVKTRREFIKHVSTSGFHFTGDNMTLNLLSRACNIDFVIFDDNYNITSLRNPDAPQDRLIVLYYVQSGHYMTIGIKSRRGKIHTLFKSDALPKELDTVLDKRSLFVGHVNRAIDRLREQKSKITLNGVIAEVNGAFKGSLSRSDKREIMTIIRNILGVEWAI
jgi:hypothetical protein